MFQLQPSISVNIPPPMTQIFLHLPTQPLYLLLLVACLLLWFCCTYLPHLSIIKCPPSLTKSLIYSPVDLLFCSPNLLFPCIIIIFILINKLKWDFKMPKFITENTKKLWNGFLILIPLELFYCIVPSRSNKLEKIFTKIATFLQFLYILL